MSVYIVTYDLHEPGKNYDKLIEKITQYKDTKKVLFSAFLVNTNNSAQQIYDFIKSALDKNDHVFISQLAKENQGYLPKDVWDWLNARI